ncbi:helix-turn-helix domain-containing protein [Actinosynnema sp. NPDC059335]|uniref:helix-turn-helix domain-containing protein n=1 Tax=Actinosynnema sp. NPDC059335 TaxID=3346804 RepID=UPI003671C5FF
MRVEALSANPTVCRRWVAMELHQLRTSRRLTLADVVRELGWSKAKAGHLETGERLPGYDDLEALTSLYETPDRLDVLWQRVTFGRRKGWWEDQKNPDQYGPVTFGRFVGLEQGARTLSMWEPAVISGLLQTRDYAWELIKALGAPSEELIRSRTALRLRRQEVIGSATLHFVLGESALRLLVGGPVVQKTQLEHLIRVTEHPNVTIRILLDDAGPHRGLAGPFTVMKFPDDPRLRDPGVVYSEGLLRAHWHDDPEEIEVYASTFESLLDKAAPADRTIDIVHRRIKELSQ